MSRGAACGAKARGHFGFDTPEGAAEEAPVKRWRSYSLLTGACVLLGLVVAFVINTTVNPLRVTPCPWSLKSLEPYRDISAQIRTGKAGLIRSHADWQGAFVGSSRVANGLDPTLPGWQGARIANLGCSAGFIYESEGICRYAMKREKLDFVVLGIDPGDLSTSFDTRIESDYYSSPFSDKDEISRELRYYFGISTLELSFETIGRSMKKELAQYTPQGLRKGKQKGARTQLTFLRNNIAGDAEAGLPDDDGRLSDLNPAKRELLRRLLEDLHRADIRVLLLYHPRHALMHAHSEDVSAPHVSFEKERRALCAMADEINRQPGGSRQIEFWDFNDYHPLNCEALPQTDGERMQRWHDLGHYALEVGNLIQSRMMGWPCRLPGGENYGTRVTAENLEAHLEEIRMGYHRYLTHEGVRDVGWKESLIRDAKNKKAR